ncbi:MAG TPA: gfo/Idh/MocA family oxidoreductase, partial [Opitutus sp.]|nr:gfo/Idh/MocA family oxidoreductase [Opitutus sp.]
MKKPRRGSDKISRRDFCRAVAGAAAVAPLIVPSRLLGGPEAPSNRIRVGHIGCGRIARVHDMPGVFKSGLADIVAVCDLDAVRLEGGREHVEKFYHDAGRTPPAIATFGNYHDLIAQKDIDAVVVSL